MKTKAERIAALVKSEHSPIRTQAALEAMSETELTGLEAHVTKREGEVRASTDAKKTRVAALIASAHCEIKTEAALNALSETELAALEAKVKTATDAAAASVRAASGAPVAQTEDEWMRTAPASVRSLVDRAKAQEAEVKGRLVASLKAAQKVYTEAELTAMSVEQLQKLAQVANVEEQPTNFGGLGFPRAASEASDDVYRNPPDGYRIALDKKSGKKEATAH
jgi:hypothetical protein